MKPADEKRLAEMRGRGQSDDSIVAFFKVHGYSEGETRASLASAKPVSSDEEAPSPLNVSRLNTKKRSKAHLLVAGIFFLAFLALVAYIAYPMLPGNISEAPEKTSWKVSAVPLSCSPNKLVLDVKNSDIAGMPITSFTIIENNAPCSPATDLQSTGIGETLTCLGDFEDGAVYTLSSPITLDDGIVCRYQ